MSACDKFASKRKRVFRYLATRERRALYLRRAFCGKIYRRPQSIFNRAACFVAKFYHYPQSVLNRRSFISKRLLETKPAAAIPPCFYFVSATACEPQILNLTRAALRQNFAEILLAALRIPIFYPKPLPARAKLMR